MREEEEAQDEVDIFLSLGVHEKRSLKKEGKAEVQQDTSRVVFEPEDTVVMKKKKLHRELRNANLSRNTRSRF